MLAGGNHQRGSPVSLTAIFSTQNSSRQSGKDVVQIQFQDRIITVKGKGLEPLCDALERLAVERIKVRPEKYEGLGKSESVINKMK